MFQSINKNILKTRRNIRAQQAQLKKLRREFEILEMRPSECVNDYFSRVMIIVNDMRNAREGIEDAKIVEKNSTHTLIEYNYIVCSIEETKDINRLFVDKLQSSLLVHEQKLKKHSLEEQALKVTGGEGSGAKEEEKFGGRCRGRGGFRGRGRGQGKTFNKGIAECYRCHKLGHFQYECPNYAHYVEHTKLDKSQEMLLMSYTETQGVVREKI